MKYADNMALVVTATVFLSSNQEDAEAGLSSGTSTLKRKDGETLGGRIREMAGGRKRTVCVFLCVFLCVRLSRMLSDRGEGLNSYFDRSSAFRAFTLTSFNRRGLDRGERPATTGSGRDRNRR